VRNLGVAFGKRQTELTVFFWRSLVRIFSLPHLPQGREGVDKALDGRGANAGEVACEGLRAVGLLPRGLLDHSAYEGDLVGEG